MAIIGCLVLFWHLAICAIALNAKEACFSFTTDDVRAQVAPIGERRWVVLLWISCTGIMKTCEGSLVDREWVLTAASCFDCGKNASVVADIGLYHSDIRHEIIQKHHIERIGADHIFFHPQYNPSYPHHNLALVHLTSKANNSYVIKLAECNQKEQTLRVPSYSVLSSGWGKTEKYSIIDAKPLQDVYLSLWSKETCSAITDEDLTGLFCAGAKMYSNVNASVIMELNDLKTASWPFSDRYPCYINYGSSLVVQIPRILSETDGTIKIVCEWQLCGIFSFGLFCENSAMPGYYTNLCMYRAWMLKTMRQEQGRDTKTTFYILNTIKFCFLTRATDEPQRMPYSTSTSSEWIYMWSRKCIQWSCPVLL